jgi:hypothetical protein
LVLQLLIHLEVLVNPSLLGHQWVHIPLLFLEHLVILVTLVILVGLVFLECLECLVVLVFLEDL